jgi:hypothetical protein
VAFGPWGFDSPLRHSSTGAGSRPRRPSREDDGGRNFCRDFCHRISDNVFGGNCQGERDGNPREPVARSFSNWAGSNEPALALFVTFFRWYAVCRRFEKTMIATNVQAPDAIPDVIVEGDPTDLSWTRQTEEEDERRVQRWISAGFGSSVRRRVYRATMLKAGRRRPGPLRPVISRRVPRGREHRASRTRSSRARFSSSSSSSSSGESDPAPAGCHFLSDALLARGEAA